LILYIKFLGFIRLDQLPAVAIEVHFASSAWTCANLLVTHLSLSATVCWNRGPR